MGRWAAGMNGEVQQAWQRQRMGLLSNSSMISSLSSCKLCGVLQDCACSHACGSDVAAAAACPIVAGKQPASHFHLLVAVLPAAQLDCRWHRHWTVRPSRRSRARRMASKGQQTVVHVTKFNLENPEQARGSQQGLWAARRRRIAAGRQELRPTGTPCGAFSTASFRAFLLPFTACVCPWHFNPSSAGGGGCAAAHPRARPGRGAGAHEAAPRQPGRRGQAG